jgi:hypothetical protein
VNASGAFGCQRVAALSYTSAGPDADPYQGVRDLAVSPDGRSLYALTGPRRTTLVSFRRSERTGALRPLAGRDGCVSSHPGDGCAVTRALGPNAEALFVDPRGTTVIVASGSFISVFRRDLRDGSLSANAPPARCFSFTTQPTCESIALRPGWSSILARFAPNGRSVSFTYTGYESPTPEIEAGLLVTLARDPVSGTLSPLAGAAGCIGLQEYRPPGVPLPPDTTCTGVSETHVRLRPPVFLDESTAVMASSSRIAEEANAFILKRDPDSSGLFPTGAPGTCWGELPSTQSPPPCESTGALGWYVRGPELSRDRRVVYVAAGREGLAPGRVLSFPVTATPASLGPPRIATWRVRRGDPLGGPFPLQLTVSRDARRLFVFTADGPALRSFDIRADGQLSGRQRECLGRAPSCRKARGLHDAFEIDGDQLVQTRDGRYLYVLGAHAGVFRLS